MCALFSLLLVKSCVYTEIPFIKFLLLKGRIPFAQVILHFVLCMITPFNLDVKIYFSLLSFEEQEI